MWFSYTLVILFVLSAGMSVGQIDQPRKPITFGVAWVSMIVNIALAIGVIYYYL